ncbi:MAG: hypothetical protein Q8Q39_01300 [bacterium]|nr:hypothetical protein [bacterium]
MPFLRGGTIGGGCNCGPKNCDHTFSMKGNGPSLASQTKKADKSAKKGKGGKKDNRTS